MGVGVAVRVHPSALIYQSQTGHAGALACEILDVVLYDARAGSVRRRRGDFAHWTDHFSLATSRRSMCVSLDIVIWVDLTDPETVR